jgi:hypothetical protein
MVSVILIKYLNLLAEKEHGDEWTPELSGDIL